MAVWVVVLTPRPAPRLVSGFDTDSDKKIGTPISRFRLVPRVGGPVPCRVVNAPITVLTVLGTGVRGWPEGQAPARMERSLSS